MKYFILHIYALLFSSFAFTQAPDIEWKKCFGGAQDEISHAVVESTSGDFVIGGSAKSNSGDVTGHHGSTSFFDYWILNTDNTGSINWQKSYGGTEDDVVFAMEQTSDNGYIVAGYTISNNGNVSGNNGYSDEWIVKLNPSGTIAWKTCLGGSVGDDATDIKETPDGGYIVAGFSYSSDSDATMTFGSGDYWLLKLDATGNIIWQKNYGGSGYDYCLSVDITSDGGYIMSGYSNSTDHDITFNHGDYDTWIVKTDADGNIIWQKSYGGSNTEYNNSIFETVDGNYFVVGSSLSNNGDVSGCHAPNTFHDYWVFMINSDGDLLWQKCYGGFNGDYATNAIQTEDKGFIITGYSASNDGDVTGHHGISYNNDIWTLKINSFGEIVWQKSLGGSDHDSGMDIMQTSDGGILICGQTESIDGDVTGNHGNTDVWLIKLECTSSIYYADMDADGFGDAGSELEACTIPTGYVLDNTDCNDLNNLIHPFAAEFCNSIDDDCDGATDEGIIFTTYYADEDADGFGDIGNDSIACATVSGYVVDFTDCNDADNTINPAATELCNAIDDDCNLLIDDDILFTWYFPDADGDGFGDPFIDSLSCLIPAGFILDNSDCNDADAAINPLATELCNAIDDDCNLLIDDGITFTHYYPDADGDGFGDPAFDIYACDFPAGYVTDYTDCNDADNAINPGAPELCNRMDDNCNLFIDEDLVFTTYFLDADGDNYGNALMDSTWCDVVTGYISDSTDCDDSNPLINPDATEILNGLDDNCNKEIDEGLVGIPENEIENNISVYPNPTHDFLIVEYNGRGEINIQVLNITGQIIISETTTNQKTILDLNSIAKGVYVLRSEMDGNISGRQFIVE